jgi:hypothetical protein
MREEFLKPEIHLQYRKLSQDLTPELWGRGRRDQHRKYLTLANHLTGNRK